MFAALGVHIIEPFFARTIQVGATNSNLKILYKELYAGMDTTVNQGSKQFLMVIDAVTTLLKIMVGRE